MKIFYTKKDRELVGQYKDITIRQAQELRDLRKSLLDTKNEMIEINRILTKTRSKVGGLTAHNNRLKKENELLMEEIKKLNNYIAEQNIKIEELKNKKYVIKKIKATKPTKVEMKIKSCTRNSRIVKKEKADNEN